MPKPRPFILPSVDTLLTPQEAVRWLQLKNERALEERTRRGDIPHERFGANTIRYWPRRILLHNGADPRILNGQPKKAA